MDFQLDHANNGPEHSEATRHNDTELRLGTMRESQRPRRQDRQDTNRAINRFFGFLIPIALLGTSGYSIWVVVIAACGLHSSLDRK